MYRRFYTSIKKPMGVLLVFVTVTPRTGNDRSREGAPVDCVFLGRSTGQHQPRSLQESLLSDEG